MVKLFLQKKSSLLTRQKIFSIFQKDIRKYFSLEFNNFTKKRT